MRPVSTMPEVTVTEYDSPGPRKHEIWHAGKRRNVLPVAKPQAPQRMAKENFRCRVDFSIRLLSSRAGLGGRSKPSKRRDAAHVCAINVIHCDIGISTVLVPPELYQVTPISRG